MTGADLLRAISAADETYAYESGQFSVVAAAIKAERRKHARRFAAIGIAAALCIVFFGAVRSVPQLFKTLAPSDTATVKTSDRNDPVETAASPAIAGPGRATEETAGPIPSEEPGSAAGNGEADPAASNEHPMQPELTSAENRQEPRSQPPQTEAPAATEIADTTERPSAETSAHAHSAEPSSEAVTAAAAPEGPQTVYRDVVVDHETAETCFMHPIVPCDRNDFNGYSVLLGSPDGNVDGGGTICISVTYLFENGSVDLRDQARTGEITPTGKQTEYRGQTFYVHTPEFNGDTIRIGFYPTGQSGVAYQAHFNAGTDVNEIMDRILSLAL